MSERKKDLLMQEESETRLSMYSKQTHLKGVYSWIKMWSLKSLVMLSVRVELVYIQYK